MKKTNWIQTWANYYSHITRNMTAKQTHSVLLQERAIQENIITRAKEHLEGVELYYRQSHLTDPHPPGEKERGDMSPINHDSEKVHTREISDREI